MQIYNLKEDWNYSITIDKYNVIKRKEGVDVEFKFKFTLCKNDLLFD